MKKSAQGWSKEAQEQLRSGYESADWMRRVTVPSRELTLFTRHLAVLLRAGVPLNQSLETLRKQCEHPKMAEVVWTLHELIEQGNSLSEAVGRFPRVFSALFKPVIMIGENSGSLVSNLHQLADWAEREERLRNKVIEAIRYPALVLLLGSLLTLGIFTWVLPPFLAMLQSLGPTLPWPTRALWWLTQALRTPGFWVCLLSLLSLGVVSWGSWTTNPKAVRQLWAIGLKIPGLAPILKVASLTRYSFAVGAMTEAGCDSRAVWLLSAQCSGNPLLIDHSKVLVKKILDGATVSQAMSSAKQHYGGYLIQFVVAAEESAKFPEMFRRLRTLQESELETTLDAFSKILEPLLLGFVGMVIAICLLSIFLPLYSHLSAL